MIFKKNIYRHFSGLQFSVKISTDFPDFRYFEGEWWWERAVTVYVALFGGELRKPGRYGEEGRKGQ